ncbi:hypothetical protein Tco_0352898 [Tanacetum coccineum]
MSHGWRKQRKETKVPQDETHQMIVFLYLPMIHFLVVLDLEKAKDAQAKEIAGLKKRVQKVASSEDKESLGAQEDASKQGRIFEDFDKDAEVSLVDETQGRLDDAEMFDTDDLHGDEVIVDMAVVTTAGKGVITAIDELILAQTVIEIKAAKPKAITTAATTTTTTRPKARGVEVQEPSEFRTTTSSPQASQPSKTKDKGKSIMIKPEVPLKKKDQVAATTTTTTRPKARGVEVQEPSEFRTTTSSPQASQLQNSKTKGKAIMIEPEVPLKKNDQVALDEEMARNLKARLQAELIEEERLARKKEEEANIALIESWDNTQAMMEEDFELAQRLQAKEQGEMTIKERSRLFVELMNKRKKHFAMLRAEEKRRKPPTKSQKRNLMSTYLKNMGGYKYNQLKSKSYDEIQKLFDNEMKRVNTCIPINLEVVKSKEGIEESSKRTEDELESDKSKKEESGEQKAKGRRKKSLDEHKEAEEDDEAGMKMHMEVVQDDEEIAIDVIPLATKPLIIVEYKIVKEGLKGFYHLIRANGSSNIYSSMIRML